MPIVIYRNPDGSVGGLDAGKVMVAPTQEEFEDCCCGEPCTDCTGEQPVPVVSVVGICEEQVFCESIEDDVLTWGHFGGPWVGGGGIYCQWDWVGEEGWELVVLFYVVLSIWHAYLIAPDLDIPYSGDVTGVHCNKDSGFLEGTIVIPGVPEGPCEGCEAHVTFGG